MQVYVGSQNSYIPFLLVISGWQHYTGFQYNIDIKLFLALFLLPAAAPRPVDNAGLSVAQKLFDPLKSHPGNTGIGDSSPPVTHSLNTQQQPPQAAPPASNSLSTQQPAAPPADNTASAIADSFGLSADGVLQCVCLVLCNA